MKKKILVLVMLVIMILQGCTTSDAYTPKKLPDYDNDLNAKQMFIGAWHMPNLTKEDFLIYKEAGFNAAYFNGVENVEMGGTSFVDAITLCEDNAIDAVMTIRNQLGNTYSQEVTEYSTAKYVHVYDEPSVNEYGRLAREVENVQAKYGNNMIFDVNLFPIYAGEELLGVESYDEYIRMFAEQVLSKVKGKKRISVDYYPLMISNNRRYLPTSWLKNLEIMAKYSSEYDATTHMFIQSMPFAIGNNVVPSLKDLSLQVYTSFAYGIKEISHFCYATPAESRDFGPTQYASIDRNNQKTPIYDDVKKVNELIARLDNVYLAFDYIGTIPILGSSTDRNNAFRSLIDPYEVGDLDKINKITSDNDILVGCFLDKAGNDGYLVSNYSETTANISCNAKIEFVGYKNALVYIDGIKSDVALSGTTLDLNLAPGEGVFVIPY